MTTATKTDVLTEVKAREKELAGARAHAQATGSESTEAEQRFTTLQARVAELYRKHPKEFDKTGKPLKATSDAGKAVKELDGADPGEAQARYNHARAIELAAEQALGDYIAAHFSELLEAIRPEGEAAAAEEQRCGQALHEAGRASLALAQRVDGWRGMAAQRAGGSEQREIHGMRIRGINDAAALMRDTAHFLSEPVPSPTEAR